jgi:polyphosphate glucokinase
MRVMVIDIGGNNVKPAVVAERVTNKLPHLKSSRTLGPADVVSFCLAEAKGCDAVVLGYPGVVKKGAIRDDPANLGPGWKGFDFCL